MALLLSFCKGSRENNQGPSAGSKDIFYARGFDVEKKENYRILKVYNPWQGARNVLFRYVLAGHDQDIPASRVEETVIRTPVSSVVCMSTTHIAMIDFIGETEKISAVSGSENIYNPVLQNRAEQGNLPDIGYDMNLNYELLLELNPDIILAYGVGAEAGAWLNRLRDIGMTVVMIGEYLEGSPLAQAEWVKFIAHLFDRQEYASDKFSKIEKEYNQLVKLASQTGDSLPVIMSGLPWRNSWFVPGGNSHFAALIDDAGGKYLWDDNNGRENFPADIENVIDRSAEAGYWINAGTALSMADIENTDPRLALLRPFRLDNVYNNNARLNKRGGNDYWESGTVNPHLILKDLIHILHPELVPGHKPVYYRKL